ncbi:MAG: alcohol dehydrogenase catalytic domain-containing protein [Desulfomonile tiedjei]|nr:alcohol dehydrogenase catalytic domain-containing protein [Desulfomonile tiedjei]
MKALTANFSLGREVWDKFRSKVLRQSEGSHALNLQLSEVPEPELPGPQWVKIRSIMSGISGMDEGMIIDHDPSAFGAFLSFPFIPGNENMGIVTEIGGQVEGIEPGERAIVNPLLSCKPREVTPLCPSCSRGQPSSCRSFAKGAIGPGIIIGGCKDTGGGWGDSFIAHKSQVRTIPQNIESDQAVLVPEFTRAVRAVLQYPPRSGDRVIIVGAGSPGLMTLHAIQALGHHVEILVVADHSFEAELVGDVSEAGVALAHSPNSLYEEVASFVKATVQYPEVGRLSLEGGADLVYETTGRGERIDDALRFAGEGMQVVLMNINRPSGFDLTPIWFKGVRINGTAFSGPESYKGETRETFDIAMDLVAEHRLAPEKLVTHRFTLEEHRQAFDTLANRAQSKAVKVIFKHVV